MCNHSEFGQMEKMLCKRVVILALVAILYRGKEQVGQFGRGPYEEHLCKIILNLG